MLELIIGAKGNGKTRKMVEKANNESKRTNGSIIYIDKSNKHMYELSNKIRLINISNFPVNSEDSYIGFISGVISQDHDLEYLFLDGFLNIANLHGSDISGAIAKIASLSETYGVNFVISISMDEHALPESCKQYVAVAL